MEDDENDVYLIKRALTKVGLNFTLIVATDGQEAIDYLLQADKKKFPHPNWIVSDLKMPKVSGLEFLTWLKKSKVQIIPTIMLSSSNQDADVLKAYQLGVASYFCKPTDYQSTIELWKMICEYWAEVELPAVDADEVARKKSGRQGD
ncbi:MAG: response regulator [Verrucomicrobiota bacterium]